MFKARSDSETSQAEGSRVYATLDGLRGVAALIVVTRHIGALLPVNPFPESFLAVDLFFLLSGFVIAHAYEARLLAGEAKGGPWVASFMRLRLIRLYPLYGLGIALGLLAALVQDRTPSATYLLEAVVIGLLMLPDMPPLPMGSSTLDGPTWTLLPELIANFVYALIVRRLGRWTLSAIVTLGAIGLVASERVYGTLDGGWSASGFPLIAARLAFSFFLGVAIFKAKPSRRVGSLGAWFCLAALAFALAMRPPIFLRPAYELVAVLLVFPAIVLVAVRREPGAHSARIFSFLGLVSYAIYVLHKPLAQLAGRALQAAGFTYRGGKLGLAFMVILVLLCAAVDRFYDDPVRAWLKRAGRSGRPAPTLAP